METNEVDIIESENDAEETVNDEVVDESTEEVDEQPDNSELEELRKKVKTLEVQKDKWRQKATKSEPTVKGDLSYEDIIALQEAKVSKEDLKEVKRYAEFQGVSIADALESNVLKTILREKAEERTSSEVLNTNSSRRGSRKVSDEALLDNAKKGILPDSDEEIMRLARLRKGLK